MAKQQYTSGGKAGRSFSAKGKMPKRKSGSGEKIFLAVVTFFNLLLSLLLAVIRRQQVIHAVQEDENVKVLLTSQKETKAK